MFWKYLLVGGILLQLFQKGDSTGVLKKYNLSDPMAICNDNSRAVVFIGRRSSTKWIIYFESGGLCTSKADCNERYLNKNSTVLMTSKLLPDKVIGRDILSSAESENPAFYDYNHVLVPYCSSDLWLGTKARRDGSFHFKNDPSVDNFSFKGQAIFRSVFEELSQKHDLNSSSDEIVVSGSSAGGIGILNHAKWLNNFTKSHRLTDRLLFIIDSAWFINFQDGFKSRVKPEFGELVGISSPACADISFGYSCCLSASCLISRDFVPSEIQIAFVFSLYDIYMFADVLKRLENEGKTAEDNVADFLTVVSMYGGAMNESLEISNKSQASFFVPACFQHTFFSTSSLWDEGSILRPLTEVTCDNGKFRHEVKSGTWSSTKITKGDTSTSIQAFLSKWVKSGKKSSIKLIDSCIGAHCNPTCPDKLVFVDAGEVWRGVIKGVVIALSLVITLICFGLKASFMCYYYYLMKRQEKYLNDSETSQARKELPLCKSDEAVSIACLSLTYTVDVVKKKIKKTADNDPCSENSSEIKPDRDSKTSLTVQDSICEEDSGSDLQEEDEENKEETDGAWNLPRKFRNDTDSAETPQEIQTDSAVASMDGHSTWGSLAGSDLALLQSHHGNRDNGSTSCLAPVSKDATDCANEKGVSSKKQILKGVSAYFNTGELVAIMGPSGCGKTTLLDLLTGRRRNGGEKQGQVYINGVGLGQVQDWYSRKIGYVLQLAVPYYEELTVRQNLFFAAHMRLPKHTKAAEKYERVEQIIAETGLTQMADTVIGGSVGLGLSGGQKRRLCVALQLINMPSVLFLDEPTSGLDASSSLEMLNHLNLVAESGRLVILTIHQPRLEIFHLFHKILFLCDGQVAYYGEPSMAPEIFIKAYARATSEEYQLSEEAPRIDAKNPADTIMDLLNCSQARRAILDYYQASGEPQAVQEAIKASQESASKIVTMERMSRIVNGAGSFNRIFVLESRTSEKQTLGQILYFPLIFFAFGLIVGTVYWQAEDRDGILLMSAYCVYCCASPLFLSSVLMAHLNKALNIFHLERQDGCGRAYENVIQTFVRTTAVCVLPVVLCSAMSYVMVMTSYDLWKFLLVTIISLVLNQTWIAVYMMVICAHPGIAHRICPMVSAIGGFAGGFLVPRPQMPVVYNLLFYINPQFYGYSAMTKVLLLNNRLKCEYESTLNCISTDGNAVLSRFGLDSVNPYEHLVIMLGMTVASLLLSWLFLEAKYFTLRRFIKTPSAFLAEPEEGKLEVMVQATDETPSKEDLEEMQLETPDIFPMKPLTRNRRSAKSRLGLISANQGFHSVKLPAQRRRTSTSESVFDMEQAIDGHQRNIQMAVRRRRMDSVSGKELWKCTRQHMEERKIDFDKRMSQVQNIARRYTIKQSQSLRRRAKDKATIPRRSTMASSAANEAMKQEFTLKRNGCLQEDCREELFRQEVEESVEDEEKDVATDFLDGKGASREETTGPERKQQLKGHDQKGSMGSSGIASIKRDVLHAEREEKREEGHAESKDNQQATSNEECLRLGEDNSSQQDKKVDKGRPVKRVSLLDITEILDV